MSILLTGGAGYIGSHIAAKLLGMKKSVIIADDFSNSSFDVIERLYKITGRRADFYELDITDKQALNRVFGENKIDAVIHLAGLKAVGESVAEPLRYYRNNLMCTINLLEAMTEHGVRRLIFSSSATVYGSPVLKLPLTEDLPLGVSTNPYGATKQMIERIITDAAAAGCLLSAVLLRYFNPAGAHPSGLIGEKPCGVPNNLMPYITQVAKGVRPELHVFGNDYPTRDGTGVRDFIHVEDLAEGHVRALEYSENNTGCEIFNLGTGRGYSVLEIVEAFERVNSVRIPYSIEPRREGDIAECWADAGKAERLLHWRAELTLQDMCRDAWNWERNL